MFSLRVCVCVCIVSVSVCVCVCVAASSSCSLRLVKFDVSSFIGHNFGHRTQAVVALCTCVCLCICVRDVVCACTCCSANVRFVFQPRCLSQPAFLLLFSIRYATQRFASFRLIFLSSFSRSRLPFKHTQAIIIGFLYSHTHSICICIRIGICIFILSLLIGPVCVFLASCFICLPG